jgi:hypothetical protein
MKNKLKPMLFAVGTSTYFTETRINDALDDAYLAVAAARQWADIKKGFVSHTISGENYYDYPENCQTESIFKISVDGDSKYEKLDFEDFLQFIEDFPTETRKIWSEYARQIFVFPTPTVTGTANLIFWGIIQPTSLTVDGDVTMFSDWADSLNMAIVQYAYADLVQNFDTTGTKGTITRSQQARDLGDKIIAQEYGKIALRLQRKHKDRPQFYVPDFFATGTNDSGYDDDIGRFDR